LRACETEHGLSTNGTRKERENDDRLPLHLEYNVVEKNL
jgi:hypothetical protein